MLGRLTRLRFLCVVSAVSLLFYSSVASAGNAAAEKPKRNVSFAPPAVSKHLQKQRAQGWKLTEVGARIAANLSVTTEEGTSGVILLATTDDPVLAAGADGPSATSVAAEGASGANSMQVSATRRDTAHCVNPARKMRSLAMTAGTGYICDWGQTAWMLYTAYYGASSVKWTQQNAVGQTSNTFIHSNCSQMGCQFLGFSDPPSGLKIVFGEAYHPTWVRIDSAWCG